MKKTFGTLPDGRRAYLYQISVGQVSASITDFGATLVQLHVPDKNGQVADVVLDVSKSVTKLCRCLSIIIPTISTAVLTAMPIGCGQLKSTRKTVSVSACKVQMGIRECPEMRRST